MSRHSLIELEAVLAIVRCGSFRAAALDLERHAVAPPALGAAGVSEGRSRAALARAARAHMSAVCRWMKLSLVMSRTAEELSSSSYCGGGARERVSEGEAQSEARCSATHLNAEDELGGERCG